MICNYKDTLEKFLTTKSKIGAIKLTIEMYLFCFIHSNGTIIISIIYNWFGIKGKSDRSLKILEKQDYKVKKKNATLNICSAQGIAFEVSRFSSLLPKSRYYYEIKCG